MIRNFRGHPAKVALGAVLGPPLISHRHGWPTPPLMTLLKKEGIDEFAGGVCDVTSVFALFSLFLQSKNQVHRRGEYNVYSTFQSHEPEFDYLKSLEIEEKINKIRWLPQQNAAYFLLSTNGTWRGDVSCLVFSESVSQVIYFSLS